MSGKRRAKIEARAATLQVPDFGRRHVRHAPAGGAEASAPIQLFAVHEEAFVEQSDLLDGAGTHAQAGADQPIHLLRLGV